MSRGLRITIVMLVVAAAVTIMIVKDQQGGDDLATDTGSALPRLVDLGSDKCAQCKMMKPILDDLRTEYEGRMDVVFIDVIPTQIFLAADGTELYRHVGFYSSQEIMAKWTKLGVEF